jgi:hypothetical protein
MPSKILMRLKNIAVVILAYLFSLSVVSQTVADGITWTSRTAADENLPWRSVAYGNGLFVAVNPENSPRVMTSPDGETWTARTAAAQQGYQSVVYGNGLFVSVNNTGAVRVMISTNGSTWTTSGVSTPLTTYVDWRSVTYGTVDDGTNPLFVAVASSGTDRVMTSPDGINWTSRAAATTSYWNAVTFGDENYVSVGDAGAAMSSTNGTTWTPRSTGTTSNWKSVTYGDGAFVAVGENGAVMTSINKGITWAVRTAAGNNTNNWESVTYGTVAGRGVFVAVSSNGADRVMTSPVTAPAFTLSSSTESRTVGTAATGFTTTSTGGPFTRFTINATPPGMSFNTTTGALTGTPDTVASATSYTVTATNSAGSAAQTFTLTVTDVLAAPAFTLSATTESRTVNTAATGFTVNSTGGAIASFSINATPPGMSFNTATGALTGTPNTVASATNYTITATNASGNATQTFTLTVTTAPVATDNSVDQVAAQAETARKAREQQELINILALVPKLGELTLSLGETTRSLYSTKCVKGKTTKFVKKGSKCPKGFVRKR